MGWDKDGSMMSITYLSGWSNAKQWKIKPIALAVVEVYFAEGGSQSLENSKFYFYIIILDHSEDTFGLIKPRQYCQDAIKL